MENHSPPRPGRHFRQMRGRLLSGIPWHREQPFHLVTLQREPSALLASSLANLELRTILEKTPQCTTRHPWTSDPPSDSQDHIYESTWAGEMTATLPAYLCNRKPFYWSQPISGPHGNHSLPYSSDKTCPLLKSLCKYYCPSGTKTQSCGHPGICSVYFP